MVILQRSADLVSLLAERGALVPAEIAEYVDTPRSSVYRLGDALRDAAMIEQVPDAHLRLSLRWLRLADAARAAMSEWEGARQVLDELAGATRQTVFLSVPRGNESICVDWARGEAINVLLLRPGRSLPLYAGAAGRVTLAFGGRPRGLPGERAIRGLYRPNADHRGQASQGHRFDQEQGYVVSDGDVTDGIGALGAPLFWTTAGEFAGALSIAGLAEELNDRRDELVETLLAAASKLSASLP